MFNLKLNLTKENLLTKTSEKDIFGFYSSYPLETMYNSEFRKDPNASANIYQLPSGKWIYKDFGENGSLNCFTYVQRKFNIGFVECLDKINRDMNLGLGELLYSPSSSYKYTEPSTVINGGTHSKSNTIINTHDRDFNSKDIDFWTGRFHIPTKLVEYYHNYAVDWFEIINQAKDINIRIIPKDICYTQNYYKDDTGILRRKIYQPYNKSFKWTSNITTLVVQGIKHLPKTGDVLIITKSMKDLLVLHMLGYNVIATNNETSFIPIEVLENLRLRFKTIFINYDNDPTGLKMGKIIGDNYNLIPIFTYGEYSDPAELIESEGLNTTKEYFKNKIYDRRD